MTDKAEFVDCGSYVWFVAFTPKDSVKPGSAVLRPCRGCGGRSYYRAPGDSMDSFVCADCGRKHKRIR